MFLWKWKFWHWSNCLFSVVLKWNINHFCFESFDNLCLKWCYSFRTNHDLGSESSTYPKEKFKLENLAWSYLNPQGSLMIKTFSIKVKFWNNKIPVGWWSVSFRYQSRSYRKEAHKTPQYWNKLGAFQCKRFYVMLNLSHSVNLNMS